jgi:hypothetical protein
MVKLLLISLIHCLFYTQYGRCNTATRDTFEFKLSFKSISSNNPVVFTGQCYIERKNIDDSGFADFEIITEQNVSVKKFNNSIYLNFTDTSYVEHISRENTVERILKGKAVFHLLKLPFIKSNFKFFYDDYTTINTHVNETIEFTNSPEFKIIVKVENGDIKGRPDLRIVNTTKTIFDKYSNLIVGYQENLKFAESQEQNLEITFIYPLLRKFLKE